MGFYKEFCRRINLKNKTNKIISEITIWYNSFLATDYSRKFENWFGDLTESAATVYDKAVDKAYNVNPEGGWMHRLFDGSHDPISMWKIVRDTKLDDTRKEELIAFMETFLKDFNTYAGLPLVTISKDSFDKVAGNLSSTFYIPKSWFADIQTLNGAELIGSSIGVLALIYNWNTKDREKFAELMSSLTIAGAFSGNPLVLLVSIIFMGRHYNKQKKQKLFTKETITGIKKGTLTSIVFIATSAIIGGAAWIGLILGLILAVIARKHHKSINISNIYKWFKNQITKIFKKEKLELKLIGNNNL